MVDLQWDLISNASQNLGNALTNAAGQVRQHRETATTRNALTNYLTNPDDQAAFTGYARRDPRGAIQIRDEHIQAARGLRAEHQQQLETLGQILRKQDGTPITAEKYPQALQLARQAGIDTTGHEAYDPDFVTATVELYNRLHPVAPVTVGPDTRLINPQTGAEIGHGNPAQTNLQREINYYNSPEVNRPDLARQLLENHAEGAPVLFDVTGDGVPDLVPRSYVRQQQVGAPPARPHRTATNPQTGQQIEVEQNEQGQWVPVQGGAPAFSANVPLTVEDRRSQYPSHAPGRAGPSGPRTFR